MDLWDEFDWTLILHLLVFYFVAVLTLLSPAVSGGEGGLLSFNFFPEYSICSRRTVPSLSRLRWVRTDLFGLFYSGISM